VKQKQLKIVGATVLLAIAGALFYFQYGMPSAPAVSRASWYYDLHTRKLFAANLESPPIDAPSGVQVDGKPAGVRAYVFSCGDCAIDLQRTLAWLETFDDKPTGPGFDANGGRRPAAPPSAGGASSPSWLAGSKVKKPDDKDWVHNASEEAKVVKALEDCPNGAAPKRCTPP